MEHLMIETPLSAAQCLQDMLLQSWGEKVRIFPAIPDNWKNLEFKKWLAEGAFEVSAKLQNGRTEFIKIKSLAGAPLNVKTSMTNPKATINGKVIPIKKIADSVFHIDLARNETVILD